VHEPGIRRGKEGSTCQHKVQIHRDLRAGPCRPSGHPEDREREDRAQSGGDPAAVFRDEAEGGEPFAGRPAEPTTALESAQPVAGDQLHQEQPKAVQLAQSHI